MTKRTTLGIDLGTNSIGWAIVENIDDCHYILNDAGSLIFPEGVAREKGVEMPAVETRTNARSVRRLYFRRRLRKIELLKVLIANGFCPQISDEELNDWRSKKHYPLNREFIDWQRTDGDNNPYFARNEVLNRCLDLSDKKDRYLLGRALYHLAQRRGFLSNRKDSTSAIDGEIKPKIAQLSEEIESAGCEYLGEYFFLLYQNGEKIRTCYTDRLNHTLKEFNAICEKQGLPEELRKALYRAIFYQRPLKSQKGLVGKCHFEPGKSRCPVSHPDFEEFRMLCFVNNVKVKGPCDHEFRPLSKEEAILIEPLFYRKSKDTFDFEDIAKKIAGKGNYSFRDDPTETPYKFNFRMSTSVAGCPLTTGLRSVFGSDWKNQICSCYVRASNKTERQIVNDVWHALYSFDSDEMLAQWAANNLQLSDKEADTFTKIKVPQGYASLSLKAIDKILPYLRKGLRYDEAVFVANLDVALPLSIKDNSEATQRVEDVIIDMVSHPEYLTKGTTKYMAVRKILEDLPDADFTKIDKIYHPSKIDIYPAAEPDSEGLFLLGSPRTSSIRNPMAMRALFMLRHLVNRLIRENKIDRTTRINIEFARELNDANKRKAIERYGRELEKLHDDSKSKILEFYRQTPKHTGTVNSRYSKIRIMGRTRSHMSLHWKTDWN